MQYGAAFARTASAVGGGPTGHNSGSFWPIMNAELTSHIRALADTQSGPFYLYDRAKIEANCRPFLAIEYPHKSIHFATMANANSLFLKLIKDQGLGVFVNSPGHLSLARELGFAGQDIVYAASAMDQSLMRAAHDAGALLVLDSLGQLAQWRGLFSDAGVAIRCNIGELVEARLTRGGYFLGKQSRLGFTLDELRALQGAQDIIGLHAYIGTDILELDYFKSCYAALVQLARLFPRLELIDFGGGFGLPRDGSQTFPFAAYGAFVGDLMQALSGELGRPIRLVLEPGRVIGGEAGYFVCRVTDVKQRNGTQLVGVNGSSVQFPRPLFYPDDAHHPVSVLHRNGCADSAVRNTSIYGCSTYSRDFLCRDTPLSGVELGDLLVFEQAGSYCASAYTHFLGFPPAEELFL